MKPLNRQVLAFIATRTVLNTTHRMVYPFLAVFGRGLGVDLATLSVALTLRATVGILGPFLAPISDTRGRKAGMLFGLLLFTLGVGFVLIWPTFPAFLLTLLLVTLGKYLFDPAMQAYPGDRIAYQQRGLVLAVTEVGWSFSFILGVPLMGLLIARQGWRAPYWVLGLAGLIAIGLLAWLLPHDPPPAGHRSGLGGNLRQVLTSRPALAGLAMGFALSAANEVVNLVFGVWMESAFGLKIAALGAATAVIGFSELGGEALTAGLVDRLGKPRAVAIGLFLNCLSALALPWLGHTLVGALIGLFLFYLTFEFTIVSSLPLMTEILPTARATLMATNFAGLSLGRALGALSAPILYAGGMQVSAIASVLFNLLALLMLRRIGEVGGRKEGQVV